MCGETLTRRGVSQQLARNDAAATASGQPPDELDDLDAPLRRELDELYSDPNLAQRLREALDTGYAIGVRPLR